MLAANSRAANVSAHITGAGPTLVLLHSLLSDRGSLEPVVPLLANDFRLVLIDLPGFGDSPASAGDLDALADRVAEALHGFCDGETPILFGNGYGSFAALSLALRHPAATRGLLLAGCGAAFSEEGRNAFRFMAAKAGQDGLSEIADVAMRRLFPPEMAAKVPDVVAERRASFLRTNPDVFRAACQQLATLDLREAAKGLAVPVLACAGDLDEATPAVMAEELAALAPRGTFHLIANCAHVPTLQAPGDVAALIRSFAVGLSPALAQSTI
ncbi:alpha/beta hydrolase [Rhodopseudomonas sp. HC1]|uniref:alpha/beta fold hydrolase n=1 Tax=Rhodopseudomonas infernalis TaxID=2897386 RepID=UPI001EE8E9A2|nr:alpha/beta hydrolase [Rhodopseudomonas infernalis]MCG6203500.1 alpha/beta hydrolase [Rhodopseudomonas infernalis]